MSTQLQYILNSALYSGIGIAILVLAFVIIEKLTPKHNLWKEVVENKNVALAIVAGFFMLAVSIIVASAIH
jgi:putative membrane protein